MKFTGKLQNVSKDWSTGQYHITFTVNEPSVLNQVSGLKDIELGVEAKKHREKRSLDANGYYWKLVEKMAEKLHVSKNFMHNKLLRRYGQREMIGDKVALVVIPDTENASRDADEAETFHIKPTSEVKEGKDGKMYRTYVMIRGSRTYDSYEMSKLIDGCVYEAKQLGIETLTPDELRLMKGVAWK